MQRNWLINMFLKFNLMIIYGCNQNSNEMVSKEAITIVSKIISNKYSFNPNIKTVVVLYADANCSLCTANALELLNDESDGTEEKVIIINKVGVKKMKRNIPILFSQNNMHNVTLFIDSIGVEKHFPLNKRLLISNSLLDKF